MEYGANDKSQKKESEIKRYLVIDSMKSKIFFFLLELTICPFASI